MYVCGSARWSADQRSSGSVNATTATKTSSSTRPARDTSAMNETVTVCSRRPPAFLASDQKAELHCRGMTARFNCPGHPVAMT